MADGGPLRLGGIMIPHDRHLVGHSDADVLLHAVTDAVLGAAALGDIGDFFPDTDPANRDRDSEEMLEYAVGLAASAGYRIANVDCIIFSQRPKLTEYKEAIRISLARMLSVSPTHIGVKAKTGEEVGAVGTEQVIQAQCVALLEEVSS